jgi:hypothetical protein
MAEEWRHSLEKLKIAADITRALAAQMAELLELREAVQTAEDATARRRPNQRNRETVSVAHRALSNGIRKTKARPGRLFMQSQWR